MSIIEYNLPGLADKFNQVGATSPVDCGCGCGCGTCGGGELVGLERTRFFARQLVGPDDLTQDQTYFRDKARRHNRLLHGWGIACGARVAVGKKPCEVVVEPGLVLGPYGDEIVIPDDVTFDLCAGDPTTLDPCGGVDPWCSDVRVQHTADQVLYLAVRYAEHDTRPVRVASCSCGCDDVECEYSRIRDSYELKVLTELPDTYKRFDKLTPISEFLLLAQSFMCLSGPRRCPPCPDSPWVILADVTIDADGVVTIDCAAHRRYVVSFGAYAFRCDDNTSALGFFGKYTNESMLIESSSFASTASAEQQAPAPPPAATVAARTADGRWLTVPGTFEVKPGEKLGQLIAREGGRSYVDTGSGTTTTLKELYAAAGADPSATVNTVADALAPLEGAKLDVAGLRVVRAAYGDLIDKKGLQQLDEAHAGSPAAATELPAEALQGVGTASPVGKHVAGKTVADVAAIPLDRFVADATKGLRGAERQAETNRAEAVWASATRVTKLGRAWGG